ncbi:MAG: O-antigen ligase family protein [Daejeonella sp.]|uniref:O-antigen ligase family protein n=1 Tax=Daejeonella sp. TaxID=2805397 RepID=UPI002735651B|nr:O-antigen ligase family protein [Daejeonella sp.]MDP3467088.1 O-antigen ligase family protein [Daejeonella sp.]
MTAKLPQKIRLLVSFCIFIFSLLFVNVLFRDIFTGSISFDYKVLYFNTIACISVVLSVLALQINRLEVDKIDILLLIFVSYLVANYLFKVNSFNNSLYAVVLSALSALLIKRVIIIYRNSFPFYLIFTTSFLLVGIIETLIGLSQLFNFTAKTEQYINGSFYNSGIFAIYTASTLMFSIAYYFSIDESGTKNRIIEFLCLTNILLAIIALPATHSRSSWMGILLTSSAFFAIRYKIWTLPDRLNRYKHSFIISLISIASMAFVMLYYYKKDSADGRIVIWKTSLIAIQGNFLTGLGFDEIQHKFGDYQTLYFNKNPDDGVKFSDKIEYAFNDFLHIFVENGLIGLLLFLLFLYIIYKEVLKQKNTNSYLAGAISGSVFILISSLFSYPFEMISIRFLFFFFLIIIMSSICVNNNSYKLNYSFTLLATILITGLCTYILWQQYNVFSSKKHLIIAQNSVYDGGFENARFHYQTALKYTPSQISVLPAYGMTLLMLKEYHKSAAILSYANKHLSDPFLSCNLGLAYSNIKEYDKAEIAFLRAIYMLPNRMYSRFLLANMYNESGFRDKAIAMAKEILTMPVKVESDATMEMKSKMRSLLNKETN